MKRFISKMKIPQLFGNEIHAGIRKEYLTGKDFEADLILQNINRGKLLATAVIFIELAYLLIDLAVSVFRPGIVFSFHWYSAMYSIMIIINLLYLFLINHFRQRRIRESAMNAIMTFYITLVMSWGSVISLMDQKLYGQLMSFMVNMMVCSIIYMLNTKRMSIPYLTSTLILAIGLPYFQRSGNILIGHYVNIFVFIVISWIASRVVYSSHCDNYVIKMLMNKSNQLLEKEIEENKTINAKLALANAQLKKIALVDELTGLMNRRSFYEFTDKMLQNNLNLDSTVSIIMIDIDYFKQYNDYYGHDQGDLALISVANQIESMVENTDQIAVRWGGEEFVYAAFNLTQEDILEISNVLRVKVLNLKIPHQTSEIIPSITISLGTCTGTVKDVQGINVLIGIADKALYQAKSSGRNCVATLSYEEKTV